MPCLDSQVEVVVWNLRLMEYFEGGRVRCQGDYGRRWTTAHFERDGGSRDEESLPASRGLAEISDCGKAGISTLSGLHRVPHAREEAERRLDVRW
jgi:hypothetical protein